jgi:multidrug efflux pump
VELPAGELETGRTELSVRADTRFDSVEDFERLVLRDEPAGGQVLLSDVARIEVGAEEPDRSLLANGRPAIGLGIIRQSGANTLTVAQGVRAELERLAPLIPSDIEVNLSYDEAVFVEGSVHEVAITLAVASALVIGVIFLFLGSLRGTLIPAATIPVSLLATFIVLAALGFSINTLTLLALVLAIGLVVDDAIVVLENVTRRHEEGEPRLLAALNGTREVGFAVVATTVVLVAVFVPLAFLTESVGRLFREFAVTLAAAVAFSGFVALTLGAALAGRLVQTKEEAGSRRLGRWVELVLGWLQRRYLRVVGRGLDALPLMLALIVLAGGVVWLAYRSLPQELAPAEDRGVVIVRVELPEGSGFERTVAVVERIPGLLDRYRGEDGPIRSTIAIVGLGSEAPQASEALVIASLKDWSEREMGQLELVARLRPEMVAMPEARVVPISPPSLVQEGGFGQPVQFVLRGPDYARVRGWAEIVLAQAEAEGLVESASLDYAEDSPQLRLSVDRRLAADLGVDARTVAEALQVFLAGADVTEYVDRQETYEVVVRGAPAERRRPGDLDGVYVRGADGLVSLATLVRFDEAGTARERRRVDRLPSVTLSATPAPGRDLGSVLDRLDEIAEIRLPPEARVSYLGLSKEFRESSAGVATTFVLALLIVYLVLAGLFESFVHPVTIMVAVPLALAGGLGALLVTGQSFNIFSQIALLLLTGLLAKNAILIVDFANQRRAEAGVGLREAVMDAAGTRFRPILMTSIATFFGGVPLALSTGPGAESRAVIGIVVLAGIVFATLVTLFVVPTLYVALGRFTARPGAVDNRLAQERRQVEQGAE